MKPIMVTVSNRGYVVLPAAIRKEMKIEPGTNMLLNREADKLILQAMPSFTQKLSGLTGGAIGSTPADVDEFIDSERKDRTS